jgi:hypothetical protein
MTTTTNALPVSEAHEEWKREHALLESMYAWANDGQQQMDMCVEVEGIRITAPAVIAVTRRAFVTGPGGQA